MWNDTLQVLAVNLLPLLKGLKKFLGMVVDITHKVNEVLEPIGGLSFLLIPLAVALGLVLFVAIPLSLAFAALTPALTAFGLTAPVAAGGFAALGSTLSALTPVFLIAAKGLVFFGLGLGVTALALVALGAGLGAIVSHLSSLGNLGDIPILSKMGGWAVDLTAFGAAAWTAEGNIADLATSLGKLKGSMEGVNLTSLAPLTETIKAVVELERLETGIPITEKLVEQIGEIRVAAAKVGAPATTKTKEQSTFPRTVNLVVQTKSGQVSFPAFIQDIARKVVLPTTSAALTGRTPRP
jgi:hypothetical protein